MVYGAFVSETKVYVFYLSYSHRLMSLLDHCSFSLDGNQSLVSEISFTCTHRSLCVCVCVFVEMFVRSMARRSSCFPGLMWNQRTRFGAMVCEDVCVM